jgi:nicotinate dehydrogenase subunit B
VRAKAPASRTQFRAADGVLLVLREPPPAPPPAKGQPAAVPANLAEGAEVLLAVWDDGSVTGLHGHVDLGTGLATALAQIVAEELDLELAAVHMLLGSTAAAPNQGATIASASIQIHAAPLRAAAAQAHAWLRAQAVGVPVDCQAVLKGRHVELMLALDTPVKDPALHRIVGTSAPRSDIPAKATGGEVFVHDKRLPGMWHGRVVRPPYAGVDAGDFIGNTLQTVDESSVAHIPGIQKIVVIRDFVGIVAEREEHAEQALRELRVSWKPWPGLAGLHDVAAAISNNPATQRVLVDVGDVDSALSQAHTRLDRRYVWPYQLHASIGPSCALADWQEGGLTVWAGTQNPHVLRADLSKLMGLADVQIKVVRMEAAGCYGRNGADDVAADAALLSRAVGRPVRVQLTREQEHAWEPKGAAQLMDVRGGLNADGTPAAYDFQTSYPSNGAPTLALLLTRTVEPLAAAYEMGDRTSVPPYDYKNLRVSANDMAPILRASWLRGVSALPNSFAHESYIDELATAAGADPVQYRLAHLKDQRAAELLRATAQRAGWLAHSTPQQQAPDGDTLKGQGVAYARYVHSKFPGFGAAFAAWVADVQVNKITGEVHVSRIVLGHDAGLMINPAGVQQQVHGNVIQTTSRALKEQVALRPDGAVASLEWGSYPILNFHEVPVIDVMLMERPGEPPLGAGESSSVPGTAAIANAIFDATGVRFRQPPFTPEVVRAALHPLPAPAAAVSPVPAAPLPANANWPARKSVVAKAAALSAGVISLVAALLGWRPAIAPVNVSAAVFNAQTIERGRVLSALGNCAACHTEPSGAPYAGGRVMATPFGKIVSTNLTPDAQTGIGQWSFSAFQRAMREGVSRDGHLLYPAFPYTSFTHIHDDDLTALYAYLMSQPAVRNDVPKSQLSLPFNQRPLMAMWNALYLQPGPQAAETTRSETWQRGAYLVGGIGHCGACHTARNAWGAEQTGTAYLAGAMVDGWEAQPLTALSHAPVPWTEAALFDYLRHGHSAQHGAAAGPMATVVRNLQNVGDADVRAMAVYLASFNTSGDAPARATTALASSQAQAAVLRGPAQRLFEGACGACHHDGSGPEVQGQNLPLALNSNLHSTRPDNLLRIVLEGINDPALPQSGHMPAFRDALSDTQIAELAGYMRQRFAPDKAVWTGLEAAAARLRVFSPAATPR